jgi:hypothetical protein
MYMHVDVCEGGYKYAGFHGSHVISNCVCYAIVCNVALNYEFWD